MKAARGMGGSGYARARFSEDLDRAQVRAGDAIELKSYGTTTLGIYIDRDPSDLHSHWLLLAGEQDPKKRDGATCDFVRVVSRIGDAAG